MRFECCRCDFVFCDCSHLDAETLSWFFNSFPESWTEVTVFLPSPHLSSVISIRSPHLLLLSLSLFLPIFSHPPLPSLLNSPSFLFPSVRHYPHPRTPSLPLLPYLPPFLYFPPRIWNCQKARVLSMPEMAHSKLCSFSSSVSTFVLYVRVCVCVYFRACLPFLFILLVCTYVYVIKIHRHLLKIRNSVGAFKSPCAHYFYSCICLFIFLFICLFLKIIYFFLSFFRNFEGRGSAWVRQIDSYFK